MKFLSLGYKPKDEIVVIFYVEPAKGLSLEKVSEHVAGESSVGTWTSLTEVPKRVEKIKPKIFEIDKNKKIVKIAYPLELFEIDNIPQILSSIAGNIFGMKIVKNLRLIDVIFPKKVVKKYKGPNFGIKGVRKVLGIDERPLLASVPKPKVGFSSSEYAKKAEEIWRGGFDFVKDDENLTSQPFIKFEKRLEKVMKVKEKVENEIGERKSYLVNITAKYEEMKKRAKLVSDYGNEYVMIDIITCGFSALQSIREYLDDLNLAIHAHRAMHASFTRNKKHGISMLVIAKLSRLIGVDNLHVGTVVGKLVSPKKEVLELKNFLTSEWFGIKKTFPVSSGGLHPGHLPFLLKFFGNDVIIQAGGGVHGHPKGSYYGAKAFRKTLDLLLEGYSLKEIVEMDENVRIASKKWNFG